jgi:hypothetical protein
VGWCRAPNTRRAHDVLCYSPTGRPGQRRSPHAGAHIRAQAAKTHCSSPPRAGSGHNAHQDRHHKRRHHCRHLRMGECRLLLGFFPPWGSSVSTSLSVSHA